MSYRCFGGVILGDVVLEWTVPHVLSKQQQLIKAIVLSAAIVLLFDAIFFIAWALIFVAALVLVYIFVIRNWKYEYEFEYVNGDMEVAKIIRKVKRKTVDRFQRKEIDYVKKGRIHEQGINILDYTSGLPNRDVYSMKVKNQMVYFEPIEEFLLEMKNYHKLR